MGLIDPACMVYRMSQRPYRSLAESLWGAQAFAVQWPVNVDRGAAQTTFDRMAEAIAAFEGSPEVNPFSAKYDYVMAGKAFTPDAKAGY
jgi:cytochrome c peroxidase